MKEELLKEMYDSVDRVNNILINDELSQLAKNEMIRTEYAKQANLRKFLEEWNSVE